MKDLLEVAQGLLIVNKAYGLVPELAEVTSAEVNKEDPTKINMRVNIPINRITLNVTISEDKVEIQ